MSAVWVYNLCFQPIIHYSLVFYYTTLSRSIRARQLGIRIHNYQLLCDEDIPHNVWKKAKINFGNIQIDYIWRFYMK